MHIWMNHPKYPPKQVPEEHVKKFESNGWTVSGGQIINPVIEPPKKRGRPFANKE